MADQHDPANPEKRNCKPGRLLLLPTGTNSASYARFIDKIPDTETHNKLKEMLRAGDFAGIQDVLKSSLIGSRRTTEIAD